MHAEQLTIDVAGQSMPAYLARPDDDGRQHPAVIVLQEIFGVNAEVKRITELVAAAGYVGLAINYYHRTHPDLNEPYTQEGLQAGFAAAQQTTPETLRADVRAAIGYLNGRDFVKPNRIATWGFCFGGTVAFVTSTLDGLDGAICFYGGSIAGKLGEYAPLSDAAQIRCPLLLVYGGKDAYISQEDVEQTEAALDAAGKRYQVKVYPEQDHAFFRDGGRLAHGANDRTPRDVADAWDLVQAFLREHLQ